jgi:foldase protein PrsA
MKSRRSILARGAFFVVGAVVSVAVLAGCGGGVPGDSIADMAGNPITTKAFNHWMYVAAKGQAAQSPGSPVIIPDPPDYKNCIASIKTLAPAGSSTATLKADCKQGFTTLRDQVMDFLVRSYWYQAQAATQHIKVSDKQVQAAFATAKAAQFPTEAQFQAFLTQTGQTLQDIIYRVRVNQIYKDLLAKSGSSVTPAAIQAYYQSHLSQFGTPETRNIRIILTKTNAQAQQALAALRGGASWQATAKKYSTDQNTKNNGGLLSGVTKGQEDAALDQAAFSAPAQKLSGPVQGQFGFYVFEVTGIKKATQQTLAQATASIRQTLTTQGQTSAQTKVDAAARKKYLSRTQCRSGYVMNDCKGYKAPSTSTTTSPGGTTTAPPATSSTPTTTT